jgi:hypothetical protein
MIDPKAHTHTKPKIVVGPKKQIGDCDPGGLPQR